MNEATTAKQPIRRLKRSLDNRVFAGVCGGLADYLGANATGIRIIWLILTIAGGAGIIAYLLAFMLIPAERPAPGRRPQPSGSGRLIFGLLLILFGSVILIRHWFWFPFDFFETFWRIALPAGLIVIGLAIMILRPKRSNITEPPLSPSEPEEPQLQPPPPFQPYFSNLRRSRRDKIFFGICGGLAEKWQIDPALVRVGWAAGTLMTHGLGFLIYFILLAVMPLEPERPISTGPKLA